MAESASSSSVAFAVALAGRADEAAPQDQLHCAFSSAPSAACGIKTAVLPPEIDLIHYYFDDIVYKNLVAISDSELSNRMKQIITDQRNEIDKRYIYLCLGAAIPYQLLHKI